MTTQQVKLQSLLFFDIITVRQKKARTLDSLPYILQEVFLRRVSKDNTPEEDYIQQAVFQPEFAKVVAIQIGMFVPKPDSADSEELVIKIHEIKSPELAHESTVISEFYRVINGIKKRGSEQPVPVNYHLATFNGKRFDIPFLSKRSIVNGIELPEWFKVQGVKPWDYPMLDIQDCWDYGGSRGGEYTSLARMAYSLDLNIDGIIPYNTYDERYHEHNAIDAESVLEGSQAELVVTMQLAEKLLSIQ